jgi:hypothetical protein
MKQLWVAFDASDVGCDTPACVIGDEEYCRNIINVWLSEEPDVECYLAKLHTPYKKLYRIIEDKEEDCIYE